MSFDFSVVAVPFRMHPGLRRLDPGQPQLSPLLAGDAAFERKLAVLGSHAEQALLCADGFDPRPALEALLGHALAEHPAHLRLGPDARVIAPALGCALIDGQVLAGAAAPAAAVLEALPRNWRLAALMSLCFVEDFAVLESDGRIAWMAVCLPSHWAPEDKIGRSFAQVHAPVADNARLLAASAHLSQLVSGPQRWERFVWTLTPQPALDLHPRRAPPRAWPVDEDPQAFAAATWLRTERQTFIPVAGRGQAVFTIRVDVQPLCTAIAAPAEAQRLHDALATMSEAVLAYRGLDAARDRLLAWLHARARAPVTPST